MILNTNSLGLNVLQPECLGRGPSCLHLKNGREKERNAKLAWSDKYADRGGLGIPCSIFFHCFFFFSAAFGLTLDFNTVKQEGRD